MTAAADSMKMLFGVDESDFSREALSAAGKLLKDNKKVTLTAFHGATDPLPLLSQILRYETEDAMGHKNRLNAEMQEILERARKAGVEAGLKAGRVSVRLEKDCRDPAECMVEAARSERLGTIGIARFGAKTMGRFVIGSVTYRLVCLSEDLPVWVVDPRMPSRDLLIALVGASISRRVIDHAVRWFGHLRESKFTLFHVIPPLHLAGSDLSSFMGHKEAGKPWEERMQAYAGRVRGMADYAREQLQQAGVPDRNIITKFQPQEKGMSRDILSEIDKGRHGILLMGRKGSQAEQSPFGLGSKAYKLLCAAPVFMTCLVN